RRLQWRHGPVAMAERPEVLNLANVVVTRIIREPFPPNDTDVSRERGKKETSEQKKDTDKKADSEKHGKGRDDDNDEEKQNR
ncbi:hypothetical protein J0S82_009374, partial [Galemys pyrenaicus]